MLYLASGWLVYWGLELGEVEAGMRWWDFVRIDKRNLNALSAIQSRGLIHDDHVHLLLSCWVK